MTDPIDTRRLALVAASQAAEAIAELLRHATEDGPEDVSAFEDDAPEQLADALQMALTIENSRVANAERVQANQTLLAAIGIWLEGWAE